MTVGRGRLGLGAAAAYAAAAAAVSWLVDIGGRSAKTDGARTFAAP